MTHDDKSITFKGCNFRRNHFNILVYLLIKESKQCLGNINDCMNPLTNICFVACQFNNNVVSKLIDIKAAYCTANLLLIGPSHFSNAECRTNRFQEYNVIIASDMKINAISSVILSINIAQNLILFDKCNVTFCNEVILKLNKCSQVLYL